MIFHDTGSQLCPTFAVNHASRPAILLEEKTDDFLRDKDSEVFNSMV